MSFNIADFQSQGEDASRPVVEIRNPTPGEDYNVFDDMFAPNVNTSRLATGKDLLIGPGQLKFVHPDEQRKMNLQVVGLRNGILLCIYDPKRSKLGEAFAQANGKWVRHEFVHKDRAYHVSNADEQGPPPERLYESLGELIEKEFPDRIVDRDDNPLLLDYVKKLGSR